MDAQAIRHLRGIDRTLRACAIGALLLIAVWALRDILLLSFAAVLVACILRGAGEVVRDNSHLGSGASLAAVVTCGGLRWTVAVVAGGSKRRFLRADDRSAVHSGTGIMGTVECQRMGGNPGKTAP